MGDVSFKQHIILSYLTHYLPADKHEGGVIFKTSQDVQDELAGIADIGLDDIACQLVDAGYQLGIREDGAPAWIMQESRV